MANINLYRVAVPAGSFSKVDWIECEGYYGPTQYLHNGLLSIDFQAQNNSVSASAVATVSIIGYCNDDCTGCYLIGETTTTSTTIPPVDFTLTPTCEGTGVNGTGKITVNGFSGGNGTYTSVGIGTSAGSALSATPVALSGASTYSFTGVFNGTWHIILRDSSGASTTKSTAVNCTNTTTTTSTSTTSTTSTSTSTTSTTTAPVNCTYTGGTAVMVYPTTTSTSTSTSTTAAPTSTTTSTSTTTDAPTTTTTTTTAAPACIEYRIENNTESSISVSWYDCDGVFTQDTNLGSGNQITFCADISYGAITNDPGSLFIIGSCAPTTTSTSTSTTTTTAAPGGSFTMTNTASNGQIVDVTTTAGAYFYFFNSGAFPIGPGQNASGGGATITNGPIYVEMTGVTTAVCMTLTVNSIEIETLYVGGSGTYTFSNVTFTSSDVVVIEYGTLSCL